MKFLHLSDLHIGKSVHGFSMLEEQKHVFQQIIRYIQSEQVTAIVIAGDIYDHAIPRNEAIRLFDDFLTDLAHANVAVLLIAGNHDSPERISYANRLLTDKQLFLCGSFNGSLQKVILNDTYGEVNFWLLPFIKPLSVYGFFEEQPIETYNTALDLAIKTVDIDYDARNVLVSHQFFTKSGIEPIRSDSELNPIGGLDAINTNLIEKFDYVALGHLHGAQKVGVEHVRYAGSPLKYSLSEIHQTKSVLLVEINEKNNLTTKALPLTPIYDMCEIKGKISELTSNEFSSHIKDNYIHIILTDEEEILDPMEKLRRVYPKVMTFRFENSRTNHDFSEIHQNLEQTNQLSPYELFSEFFLAMGGCAMSQEQLRIVKDLLSTEDSE
ncbi:exonuclease SbcCD subunit D [Candidatus Bathycorpusculum sp.]|jgi:exonuclease SbcD|uniref:exonuclease SbcCD subunit D n=1 Tax=Candidatus Bathycorpusculum sp. TaxID=2994959 RepID=UPI00282DEA12|nr:exonuclease SbcCD subunit D [Candidatus Termitimicrobium sp.]MCL2432505.1 exonuclease SbcCD subunit D [Candidatus Termitimicrobium sp.]MDR0470192.1 exonuclease SbcCD subunit D [Nitrososphaerota archaeon]